MTLSRRLSYIWAHVLDRGLCVPCLAFLSTGTVYIPALCCVTEQVGEFRSVALLPVSVDKGVTGSSG